MNSKVTYKMHGFNTSSTNSGFKHIVRLNNNSEYNYQNHSFLQSVFIDDEFKRITFTLLPDKNAKDFQDEIEDELEKICFNIITYSDISTSVPFCELETITDEVGETMDIHDKIQFYDCISSCRCAIETSDFYELIMSKNTPLSDNKAKYKELFYVLHNPHKTIQFIALYDILLNLICSPNESNRQKRVRDFFGKNRNKYPFIKFHKREDSEKTEDTFTYIRNLIAHSQEIGIDAFLKISDSIRDKDISNILSVINDIISGEVQVR